MTKTLSSFYPIFDSADWIERLVPLGIKLVQLRIKDLPEDDIAQHIRRAQAVCRQHNCTLIINDYWQLAMSMGCDWVHLGQEDLDTADIDAIRAAGLRLGISTHDHQELKRALALSPDYVALGPVYPTILKKMKWHEQGLDRVTEWKALVGNVPLVAIGGMSVDRAALAFSAGADIVAAVTDITLHANPELRVKQWLEACS
ncbi:MAG: thiamine phosphate synthase [Pseudomonadota bacterium]|jgi:thiamine-phosphate pyrophosphorylase|uniref:thiamine phosphate synthase n=1 Tax=Marisediminitalea TaxID=2662254 RepID=UPI0020CC3BC5|nr:thiamine phosphate synthase [Marisediminitalea aggregata]MCP3864128.1 thiamine phosphate synthase [Aestuariibacter sp.]MEC8229182.1 thiamine phosphate synthase [Pseudomonadota bacterium]MCP4528245.1 thiamine phosphate synthase [Aestuariibacter sp.]MCP4948358.1 thiamine phosphate synthase [Aestuariibacter sp.]MCP9479633.1 thiamine phosphate synthase [Marisediminitalea aggregata]|tara:strand:- start:182 stop:784 length:603 start_codon:yes stop_codon:yes gene_type:complete